VTRAFPVDIRRAPWSRRKERAAEWAHVFTVRGGKIVRFWGIYDTEASAAARS